MSDESEAAANEAEQSKDEAPVEEPSPPPDVASIEGASQSASDVLPQSQKDTPKQPPVAQSPATDVKELRESVRPPGPAMIKPDAPTSRRARARMTLRIPDDNVPISRSPSSPDLEAQAHAMQRMPSSPDLEAMAGPAAMIRAMRIISVGENPPGGAAPAPDLSPVPAAVADAAILANAAAAPLEEAGELALTPEDIVAEMAGSEPAPPALAGTGLTGPQPVSGIVAVAPPQAAAHEDEVELSEEEITPDSGSEPPPAPAPAEAAGISAPMPVDEMRDRLPSFEVPIDIDDDGGKAAAELSDSEETAPRAALDEASAEAALASLDQAAPRAAMNAIVDTGATALEDEPPTVRAGPMVPPPIAFEAVAPAIPPPPAEILEAAAAAPVASPPPPVVSPEPVETAAAAPSEVERKLTPSTPDLVEVADADLLVEEAKPEVDEPKRHVPPPAPPPAPKAKPPQSKPAIAVQPAAAQPAQPPAQQPAQPQAQQQPASISQPPKPRVRVWWEDLFTDDFVRSMDKLTPDQVKREVKFIEESLAVQKGGVMLDLGCGAAQHAVELAARGYNVVGYDLSLTMLALAADEAQSRGQKLNFLQGDMRDMAFEEMFDGVFSWSTSFGYFDHDKNCEVIRRVNRALRTGGMFLLDLANRDYLISRTPSMGWFEGDGCVCMDEAKFDCITSRLLVKRTLMLDDGRSREIEFSIRLYSLHEIGKMVNDAGFKVVEVSGHPATAGVFMGAESPRLITLAEKR
jgi:SAM-dependent methyltransferase